MPEPLFAIERFHKAEGKLLGSLKSMQTPDGHWLGCLSTSALSTATAVSALSLYARHATEEEQRRIQPLVQGGLRWLINAQNADGGFGDTERSHSNIATSYLVLAAIRIASTEENHATTCEKVRAYLRTQGEWDGLRKRYGKDKTFVVPIMTNCALAGMIDWREIPALPFEAAALPQSWYRFAKLPVVSYAIPALVAIGQARFHFAPPWNPIARLTRNACRSRTLHVLQKMQPESGGYLEATPLTSFVLMSLASIGLAQHPVSLQAVRFLVDSVLQDGSWPIDTNLATWVTSLATRAILHHAEDAAVEELIKPSTVQWLLSCQHRVRHPFTGADPGGWGWTDLSGAVPDADDTPAALLALGMWSQRLGHRDEKLKRSIDDAASMGIEWLLGLQNRDGGWPTFCRGWGQLPFDRSGSDLTAHAMRSLSHWRGSSAAQPYRHRIDRALQRGLDYLAQTHREDGSWLPLWFGNQDNVDDENAIYGTSRVLVGLAKVLESKGRQEWQPRIDRALQWLQRHQNADGGWGGGNSLNYPREMERLSTRDLRSDLAEKTHSGDFAEPGNFRTPEAAFFASNYPSSSIEETALAVEALAVSDTQRTLSGFIMPGIRFLVEAVEKDWTTVSWPIGFYFAKLWYHEQLYPWVYTMAAFQSVHEYLPTPQRELHASR